MLGFALVFPWYCLYLRVILCDYLYVDVTLLLWEWFICIDCLLISVGLDLKLC